MVMGWSWSWDGHGLVIVMGWSWVGHGLVMVMGRSYTEKKLPLENRHCGLNETEGQEDDQDRYAAGIERL